MISTYLGYKLYGNNLAQSLQRTAAEPTVAKDQAYYNANIGKVKSVDDLVNNYRLLSYATQAFGLGDMTYAKSLLKKVLTSNLSDPKSVANQLNDTRYTAFAHAFNFSTTGTLSTPLQSTSQQAATEKLFLAKTNLTASDAAAATKSYETAMSSISSISQLEQSPAALGYVLIAYGIDPNTVSSSFEQTLESDLSNTSSFVNKAPDSGYTAFAQAFNVASDGTTSTATEAQSAVSITTTTNAYMSKAGTSSAAQRTATAETTYYVSKIGSVQSASALVADSRLLAYVKTAFGLPSGATKDAIVQALSSDPTNKKSYANTSPYASYATLAKAFNFKTTGDAGPVAFQSSPQVASTIQLYQQRQTADTATSAAATAYYRANIGNVQSVSDLQKDPKLLNYTLTAYGIDPSTPSNTIAAILQRTKTVDTGLLALSQAFNVASDGTAATKTVAQTDSDTTATSKAYMTAAASDYAAQKAATVETDYFKSKIAGITSVSDLTSDSRLVAYVSQAFGLPKNASATTIQQALTSDLTDKTSFANTNGTAYLQLAKSFNFDTSGAAKSVTQFQSIAQQSATTQLFTARDPAGATTDASATAYYNATIGSIHSVAELQANSRLTAYVLTAYGVDTNTPAATIAAVLRNTGGIDDTYRALSNDYNVNANGTVVAKTEAQPLAKTTAMTTAYMAAAAGDQASQDAATAETTYVQSKIANLTSVDDLVGDSRLLAYVTKAYNLPSGADATSVTRALTSDLTDTTSFANTNGTAYLALAKAFNFSTSGAAGTVSQFQTAAQQQSTTQRFAALSTSDQATIDAATAYYTATIGAVRSVGDLEADPKLMTYLETAYGLDPSTPGTTITALLETTHTLTDTAKNASLLALKMAFNTDAQGKATSALAAQSAKNVTATTTAYLAAAKTDTASQTAAKTATAYYNTAIANVTSVNDLLADSKLVVYLKQAYSLPATTTTDTLRKVLTSDLGNKKSVANTMGPHYEQLAAAFDFTSTGTIAVVTQQAQSKAQLDALNTAFVQQKMEDEAGVRNAGIKLALYLQLNASKITDAYSLLADKQLTQIVHTILGLPATASNADIDAQAKAINKQINIADFKDPKKLDALIQRFSVLYDLNPPASTTLATQTSLFSGSTDPVDVTNLFTSSS